MRTLLLLIFMSATFGQQKPATLEDFRWKNRVLLIFSSEFDFEKATALKKEQEERKLIYFVFEEDIISNSNHHFSEPYKAQLIKKYSSEPNTAKWILIGLDGGVKLQEQSEINWEKVFKTIDSMPMRQSEMESGFNQQ